MLIRLLRTYLRRYRWLLLAVVGLQAVQVVASLWLPSLNADIIDIGVRNGDTGYIWRHGLWMLGFSVVQIVFSIAAVYYGSKAAMAFGRDVRSALFHKVTDFSAREVAHFGAPSLITRVTNDVQQVQTLVYMTCTLLIAAPLTAIGGLVMALREDVELTWILAVAIPVLVISIGNVIYRMVPTFRRMQERIDEMNGVLREQITGIRVVRAFVREPYEVERFATDNDLLTRTALYRQLGGFDEAKLQVAYNDVDYCLRAGAAGFRTVITPQAVLRHVGSASRAQIYAEREHLEYIARHGTHRDPYLSETLQFPPRNLPLNPYHQRSAETPRPFRALLLTPNLKFEGAPIFLFELARYLAAQPGVSLTVATAADGPLRARFEAAGIKVETWDVSTLAQAPTPAAFATALKAFAATRNWDDAEVFVANTLLAFWGVHLAAHLGRPSALYIHESSAVKRFFQPTLPALMHPVAEEALRLATRVVFTAQSTRAIHEELNLNDNFRLLPSWVDFARIDAFAAAHDPAALRRKHGLDPDAAIVVNIGSVCERKGQHIYIRGIDRLRGELPALFPEKKIQWIMVGARPGLYMETLQEDIQLMGLQDTVKIFPETPDIYDFYRLADLLVCTSFEESFPRVILEAMAFGNRIVSTDVNGIAEMLTNTDEAWLVPAGDQHKLAAALKAALTDHFNGDRKMLSMARARAARHYHHARTLPRHLQVIREAWLG